MTCPDCQAPLDEVPINQPCPKCGGLRRSATATPPAAMAHAHVPRPTIAIGYDNPRPWQQKWQDVQDGLKRVETIYASKEAIGNEEVRRPVEEFFKACRELADWLWGNSGVKKPVVIQLIRRSPYLRLADGMAQTTKHHTRTGKDPMTARIAEIRVGPDGARARIAWARPSGASGSGDALYFARGCVRAWRRFLRKQQLQ